MTTIAYRDGILAADTQSTAGRLIQPGEVVKIVKGPKGQLGAACGSASFCEGWKRFVLGEQKKAPEPTPPNDDGGGDMGLIIHPDGRVEQFEHNGSYFVAQPYIADGAGSSVAMGAMFMGATAEEAIRAAIAHDAFTGGSVTVLKLAEAPQPFREGQ